MLHYTSHPTHTKAACGALLNGTPTPAELDPRQTTCQMCLTTLCWRVDSESQTVLRAIDAGAQDAQAIVESARIMLAAALTIIERLQRCHQIIQDSRGHFARIKAGQ